MLSICATLDQITDAVDCKAKASCNWLYAIFQSVKSKIIGSQ